MSTQIEQTSGAEGARAACAACGARAQRPSARYCSTCGRTLGQDYFPTDSLRASYRFDRPAVMKERAGGDVAARRNGAARLMQPRETNGAASTALAFATYALVPYVGILFCPGAVLAGGIGLLRSYRAPHMGGGRRSAATGLLLGLLILCAQLLLWWLLYKVPEWSSASGL
jgi:hypothetical protein